MRTETKTDPATRRQSEAVERIARKNIRIEILEDVDSGSGGARFIWEKNGEEREYVCALSDILGPRGAAFQYLADTCLGGFSSPKDLRQFVNDALDVASPAGPVFLLKSTKRAGWREIDGHQIFVGNGWHLGNGKAPVLVSRRGAAWQTLGDAGQYFARMGDVLTDNPAISFICGFFVAGSLVKLVRAENFILSIVGRTSIGKTLAIKTALSFRGDPAAFPTFYPTPGALKSLLRQACDSCLPIDEIGQSGLRADEKQKLIHDISAGKERGRLKKTASGDYAAEASSLLSYTVILTGEESMSSASAAGGASVRSTELFFDETDGKRLWSSVRGSAQAEEWDNFLAANHGWLMPKIIEIIASDPVKIKEKYAMQLKLMREYASQAGEIDGATARKLKMLALSVTGAELVDEVLEASGEIVDGAVNFALGLVEKGAATDTTSDRQRFIEFMHSLPARYSERLFLINGDGSEEVRRGIGAVNATGNRTELRILIGELPRLCDHDHIDMKRFLEWAKASNVLQYVNNGGGKRTFSKRLHVGATKASCFQFLWFQEDDGEGSCPRIA